MNTEKEISKISTVMSEAEARQCVALFMNGKNYKQISEIMKKDYGVINKYMTKVKRSLGMFGKKSKKIKIKEEKIIPQVQKEQEKVLCAETELEFLRSFYIKHYTEKGLDN